MRSGDPLPHGTELDLAPMPPLYDEQSSLSAPPLPHGAPRGVKRFDVVDVFCGVGGFSAGARRFANAILGVDNDDLMVRLWSANTRGVGKLAELWTESIEWPDAHRSLHVHLSPPCTTLSKARRVIGNVAHGLAFLRESLQLLTEKRYTSWSIETVSTPTIRQFLTDFNSEKHLELAWTTVDAAEYGSPSTRVRIIVGNRGLIRALRQIPVTRVTVADAFYRAGVQLPVGYIKNNTKTRAGRPCLRGVHEACHTQTASHPLTWCTAEGQTVRCLSVRETAIIMGFPDDWMLPSSSRDAFRALGNAVPPPLSSAIMAAAVQAASAVSTAQDALDRGDA